MIPIFFPSYLGRSIKNEARKSQRTLCNMHWSVTFFFSDDDVYNNVMLKNIFRSMYSDKKAGEWITCF